MFGHMPTLDELKRFSHEQGANSRAESLALDDRGPARKRAKTSSSTGRSKRDYSQTFHGDPNGNAKLFLAWPLTQAMVDKEANTSRRLRAYRKIFARLVLECSGKGTTVSEVETIPTEELVAKRY